MTKPLVIYHGGGGGHPQAAGFRVRSFPFEIL